MSWQGRTFAIALTAGVIAVVSHPMHLLQAAFAQDADGAMRDLSGVWMPATRTRGFPVTQWTPDDLPFTVEGRAMFDANIPGKGPRERPPALGNDPIGNANPPGLYRTLVYPRPWEFVQTDEEVVQIFEWGKHWRKIWTDGRDVPGEMVSGPYWYGYSVGRWEGDILVVTTNNIDGRQWMDEWGTPVSEYDAVVEERWRRVSEDRIELTITVRDAQVYSRAWTSTVMAYERQPEDSVAGEPIEQIFAPIDEVRFNETIRDPAAGLR
jgi:hypothetical protein